ncbi:MAG: VPA1269 family protein [Actinomycetota bacterium]
MAVADITDTVIGRALARYDAYWHDVLVTQFSTASTSDVLPVLFSLQPPKNIFKNVRRELVRNALGAYEDCSTSELVEGVRSSGRCEELARDILGCNLASALSALSKAALRTTLYQDMRAFYNGFVREASGDAPIQFATCLTDFEDVQRRGINLTNAYAMLVALYSEGCLLHPFGLWRAVYPSSGEGTPQRYMEGASSEHLLRPGRSRDLREMSKITDSGAKGPQALRLIQCLLLSTHVRLVELDQEEVLKCVNTYFLDDGFQQRPDRLKQDSRAVAVKAMKVLAEHLIASGNVDAIQLTYPKAVIDGFIARKKRGVKGDGEFRFLADAGLPIWAELLAEYLKHVPVKRKKSALNPLLPFADWLIAHGADIRDPEGMTRSDAVRLRATARKTTLVEYLTARYPDSSNASSTFGQARLFLEWYRRERNEHYRVPLLREDQPRAQEYLGKTTKESLPARVIELMKEILSENDWAWPRQFTADEVTRLNTKTGVVEKTWCPVRAKALYVMLWVPIRSIQVRLLDSGEFDELYFDRSSCQFVPNPVGLVGRRLGVLREYSDARSGSAKRYIGLYINTNKTQKLFSARKQQGYEIQWERQEIIDSLLDVRDWQETYNPIIEPIHVNSLEDSNLHATEASEKFIPPYAFLFRDAASIRASSWEPVSHQRLNRLFIELCAEAERRLQAEGVPVKLIDQWEVKADGRRVPTSAIVTLHSLRVSGITNFAEGGCPLNIITEFLAGHSTILMNIWYQKFGFAKVNSVIERASSVAFTSEGLHQFQHWIDERAESTAAMFANVADDDDDEGFGFGHALGGLFTGGSSEALKSLQKQAAGLWHVDIDGICPNGRTGCDEGGPRIGTKGWTRGTHVPGGRGNCPRCRFWVTGPMFIFGQIVKSNVLLYHIQEQGVAHAKLQDELDDLQQVQTPTKETERRIAEVRASIQVYDNEIENALQTWAKRYEYAVRSVGLLREDGDDLGSGGQVHRLLTTNSNPAVQPEIASPPSATARQRGGGQAEESVRVTLTETHPLALMEFVVQACEVIPGVDVASARLKKNKLLDMMLDREGKSPLFFKLSEEDALRAGNALTRFLANIVDQQGVSRLLAGEVSLAELGLTDALDRGLEAAVANLALPRCGAVSALEHDDLTLTGGGHG